MPAGIFNFNAANKAQIEQGATFEVPLVYKDDAGNPVPMSGWTGRMHIRQTVASATTLATLTTENGKMTIHATNGTITLTIPATETSTYAWTNPAVYDIELVDSGGKVKRLLKGEIELDYEVTR